MALIRNIEGVGLWWSTCCLCALVAFVSSLDFIFALNFSIMLHNGKTENILLLSH